MDGDGRMTFDAARWREVEDEAARLYERVLVPGVFAPWAGRMLDLARIGPGMNVLDVACGTGVLARAARQAVEPGGAVSGLDLTPSMIQAAASIEARVDWRVGDAAALPFDDGDFDAVVCQAGMMFFSDRAGAVREMRRVLTNGGRVVISVWAASPGQEAFARVLDEHVSPAAGTRYRAPWSMTDARELADAMAAGGFDDADVRTLDGWSTFPSVEMFLESTRILLAGEADPADLVDAARSALRHFIAKDGSVAIPSPANVGVAWKN